MLTGVRATGYVFLRTSGSIGTPRLAVHSHGQLLQEHSVVCPSHDVVITMLWDAAESDAPRPPEATLQAMRLCRDHCLGELEANPNLVRNHA